jgi:hypothetical protein
MLFGDDAVITDVSDSSNRSSRLVVMLLVACLLACLLLVAGCYLSGMAFEACENSISVFYCSCWKSIDLIKFVNACKCLATKSLLVVGHAPSLAVIRCFSVFL